MSQIEHTEPDRGDGAIAAFEGLDVCVVNDALDRVGLSGYLAGLAPLWEGASMVGRAVTVTLTEGAADPAAPPVHLGATAIDLAGPGRVIVVDNAGRLGMGAWGGLLCAAAAVRGINGVVVNGACRDVDEARELRFPVFAAGRTAVTARGRVHETATGSPVIIAAVTVRTGDLIVADGTGVVVVPQDRVHEVAEIARDLAQREQRIAVELRAGTAARVAMGASYEHALRRENS